MAGSVPVNDVPDLVNYHAGQRIHALWNGPKKLAESFLNLFYDYQLSWDELGFLSSNPNIDDGKNWKMVRPLGSGGFGMVGLWHAVDVDGNVVDEMAIKQTRSERSNDWSGNHPGLAKEAVLQYQLNQRNSENVVLLRRYKFYDGERKYRFYMEVCSHGELYRLRYRYRNWGTLLPELFLWHVFHSLAKVLALMDGPFNDFATGKPLNQSYMLHMDLKHANIFLSEPASHIQDGETDPTSGYPIIKLGDFGLADITAAGDPNNPQTFWGRGTVDYMPPVGFLERCCGQNADHNNRNRGTSECIGKTRPTLLCTPSTEMVNGYGWNQSGRTTPIQHDTGGQNRLRKEQQKTTTSTSHQVTTCGLLGRSCGT